MAYMASGSAYASSYLLKEDQMGSSLQAALPVFDQWLGNYGGELGVKKVKGTEYCCIYDITVELHIPYSTVIRYGLLENPPFLDNVPMKTPPFTGHVPFTPAIRSGSLEPKLQIWMNLGEICLEDHFA